MKKIKDNLPLILILTTILLVGIRLIIKVYECC
jgi:hypothetical protein